MRLSSLPGKTKIAQDIQPGRKNRCEHLSLVDETVQHEHLSGINMPDDHEGHPNPGDSKSPGN